MLVLQNREGVECGILSFLLLHSVLLRSFSEPASSTCSICGRLTFRAHPLLLCVRVSGVRGQEYQAAYLPVSRPADPQLVCDAEGLLWSTRGDVATADLEMLSTLQLTNFSESPSVVKCNIWHGDFGMMH